MSYEQTKKWRLDNTKKRNEMRTKYYKQFEKTAYRKGMRYTDKEIKQILDHTILDRELAFLLKRSVKAIQIVRSKIKNA